MTADLTDRTDFDNANRGLVARLEPGVITGADGGVVYDADAFTTALLLSCRGQAVPPSIDDIRVYQPSPTRRSGARHRGSQIFARAAEAPVLSLA